MKSRLPPTTREGMLAMAAGYQQVADYLINKSQDAALSCEIGFSQMPEWARDLVRELGFDEKLRKPKTRSK